MKIELIYQFDKNIRGLGMPHGFSVLFIFLGKFFR